jgi:transposase-like protein/predicted nucleic acid-binding Zn finger protein
MTMNDREPNGNKIANLPKTITRISKNHYRVLSQSQDKFYNVKKLSDVDVWTCECPDFMFRLASKEDKRCKHIIACQAMQKIVENENKIEKIERQKICPRCISTTIIKIGFRTVKGGIRRRRYQCKQCNYKFCLGENGFGKISSDPKVITESLNLIFSGMSYRNTARHISLSHNVKLSHVSILNWFRKYTQIMKDYVDNLTPEKSQVWSADEMMLNVKDTKPIEGKGLYDWMWSIIDPQTKFVIASEISKKREIADAQMLFISGKQKTKSTPNYVITDALHSYERAIRNELDVRKTAHIKTKSLSEGFANRPIERYHNEVRSIVKSKRGLGNDRSAQEFADGYRIYHNYCRPHTGLPDKKTPAEAAGLDLNLGENKIRDLIVKSTEPNNFATQLGLRIDRVIIVNEKDSIKVSPKGWIEKQTWREINDILRLNGFSWLSNDKDSCWMKLLYET